jgi:signal transduction histidine kinase/uncharacterized protein YhfF
MAPLSAALPSSSEAPPSTRGGDLLRTIAAGTAGVVGDAFFRSLVRQLAAAFDAEVAFVAEWLEDDIGRARILASWDRGCELPEGHEFPIEGTPCSLIAETDVVTLPSGVVRRFPRDGYVAQHQLDGYLAVAMRGAGGELVGHIAVASRGTIDPHGDEITALTIFAARAAAEIDRRRHQAALRAREAEIAASRARMLQATDDERRRIGRDLHDGAQQRIVALSLMIDMARRKLAEDPGAAEALLEQARDQAGVANQELRELVRGLHPAGLAERGLGHALEALKSTSPVPLEVVALPERRLPEPVEVTIYFIVSEGLTNAAKYASASRVQVTVEQRGSVAVAAVDDDGVGGAEPGAGTGLHGLGDRVRALGGTLEIDSPPGAGTRLTARIPLAPWRSAREPFLEFGHEGDGGLGERLIGQVLAGEKTVTVSLAREWELEGGTPRIGQDLPILDHTGRRRATAEVVRVAVVPFGRIGADIVSAERAGASSVDDWRATQRRFYDGCRGEIALLLNEPGWRLTDDEPMVIIWFRLRASESKA